MYVLENSMVCRLIFRLGYILLCTAKSVTKWSSVLLFTVLLLDDEAHQIVLSKIIHKIACVKDRYSTHPILAEFSLFFYLPIDA